MHTFKNNVEVNSVYYRDNVEIRNSDVTVNHSNGRVVYTNGAGAGDYQYYLKDHLGNVRLTISDKNNDGKATTNEVIGENHYYPFGLKMEGDWNSNNTAAPEVTNQYNSKEWVDDLGLGMNDYGARWYDPATARWNSVDPLAEKYVGHSPYNYVLGNPVKYIDPDGRSVYESRSLGLIVEVNDGIDKHFYVNETDFEWALHFSSLITNQEVSNEDVHLAYNEFFWNQVSYDGLSLANIWDYYRGGPKLKPTYIKMVGDTPPGFEMLSGGPLKGVRIIKKSQEAANLNRGWSIRWLVKGDPKLLQYARETFKGNKALSREARDLLKKFSDGNVRHGINNKSIGNGIHELKSAGKARIYYRKVDNGIEILGYSNKTNQQKVINRIKSIYGK